MVYRLPLQTLGVAIVFFHLSEVGLAWHYTPKERFTTRSLLITPGYCLAMACGLAEYVTEASMFQEEDTKRPDPKMAGFVPGLLLIIAGELIRKAAMVTAQGSFTHCLAIDEHPTNTLVTKGVYRINSLLAACCSKPKYLRHPGYFGWGLWAIGTQVLLSNPLCTLGFALVIWRFFKMRIAYEEAVLVRQFGEDYTRYAAETPTLIPFIA